MSKLVLFVLMFLILSKTPVLLNTSLAESVLNGFSFSAAEYFYPIKPEANRSHLPERLTFEPVTHFTLEDLKKELASHEWKILFHCQGQALHVDKFKIRTVIDGVSHYFADGIINPSVTESFSFDQENTGVRKSRTHAPEINIKNYLKVQIGEGPISIVTIQKDYIKMIYGESFVIENKLVRVRETGEIVLEYIDRSSGEIKICPDGTKPTTILAPLPNNLLS